MLLLLALLLQQNPVAPIVPVQPVAIVSSSLPEAPKPNFFTNVASHVAFVAETRKVGKSGRVYGGGVLIDFSSHITVSAGYEEKGWDAGAVFRPVVKK